MFQASSDEYFRTYVSGDQFDGDANFDNDDDDNYKYNDDGNDDDDDHENINNVRNFP